MSFEREGDPCLPSLSATACHEPILRWSTCLGSTCHIARYLLCAGLAAFADTSHMRRPKARPRSCACGRKQWLGHGSIKRLQMRFQQEKQETQIHKNPSCGPLFPKTWRCGRLLFGSHFWVPKMAQKRGLKVTHFKQKHKESVLNKCQVVQFLDPFLGPISGPRNGSKIGPLFYRKNVLEALELHAP